MTHLPGEVWFLASCIEFYKDEKGMSGGDAWSYFRETGALGFLIRHWGALHTTSPEYVIDSIDEYIRNHPANS
jgi:hypothetical protein